MLPDRLEVLLACILADVSRREAIHRRQEVLRVDEGRLLPIVADRSGRRELTLPATTLRSTKQTTHTRAHTHSTLSLLLRSTVGAVARRRQREGSGGGGGLARTEPRGDFRAASVCWTSLWCSSRSFLSVSIASAAPRATTRCEHAHKPQSADRQVRKRLGGRERSGRSNRTLDLPAPSAASPEAARSAPYWCSLATAPALSGPPSRRPQTSA